MSDFGIIIPARFKSSRFPGKPLVKLNGREMILHVADVASDAIEGVPVYVATDDRRIGDLCEANKFQVVYTSEHCLTGTDRVAEAVRKLGLKGAVNVQGDEPMVSPEDIRKVYAKFLHFSCEYVVNGVGEIRTVDSWVSSSVPKVVFDAQSKIKYMSRSPIPGSKSQKMTDAYRQVCIYAFSLRHLDLFSSVTGKTRLEEIEDIEILRFLELGQEVLACEVSSASLAIDHPEDVTIVEKAMRASKR